MDQPGAMLELCERVVVKSAVDVLLDLGNFFDGGFPVPAEDLGGELAPGGLGDLVVIRRLYRDC